MTVDTLISGGNYESVVAELSMKEKLNLEEQATLGICYFRLGNLDEAETPLLSAHLKGSPHASVEYGNYLRRRGQLKKAKRHFEEIMPQLTGELLWRSKRWLGVSEFQLGNVVKGIELVEQALQEYLKSDNNAGAAKVTVSLAKMMAETGNLSKASSMYKNVIDSMTGAPVSEKIPAIQGWLDLLITYGSTTDAERVVEEVMSIVEETTQGRHKAILLSSIAAYHKQAENWRRYGETLKRIESIEGVLKYKEISTWLCISLADYYTEQEDFAMAHKVIDRLASPKGKFVEPEAKIAVGRLCIAQGNFQRASRELGQAVEQLESGHMLTDLVRARLSYAYALMRCGDRTYLDVLEEAIVAMRRNQLEALLRFDVKRYRDMLFAAALEPQLAAQVEGLIGELDSGLLPERAQPEEVVRLEVQTMRHLQARLVGERVHLSPGAVALLAYLSMQPGQTRPEVQSAMLSERTPSAANSAFKAYLAEIRKGLGADAVRVEGDYRARRYSLHPRFAVRLDLQDLFKALQEGDLASAFSAARGEFMPGLEHSEWVELQREKARSALLALARQRIAEQREHAPERAILVCNEYLKTDADELEMHRLRVQLAAQLKNPVLLAEAAAAYAQLSGESAEEALRGDGP